MEQPSQWVQHISGQGEKWEVARQHSGCWKVVPKNQAEEFLSLSEYILCTPPEVWEDVTSDCYVDEHSGQIFHKRSPTQSYGIIVYSSQVGTKMVQGYRKRKVNMGYGYGRPGYDNQWAFIVERKKS